MCVGKSGLVAERLAGSLSSIGIPSQYVNAVNWVHGDLGICYNFLLLSLSLSVIYIFLSLSVICLSLLS